jgi:hypothetical protein
MPFEWVFLLHISAYLVIGILVGFVLARYHYVPKQFIVTTAFAFIAILYYLVFFISLLNPNYGLIFNTVLYIVGLSAILYGLYRIRILYKSKTIMLCILLPIFITVLVLGYYSVLLGGCRLHEVNGQTNTSFCYLVSLPIDNTLPLTYAKNIQEKNPKDFVGDWNLVDRPPIQIGAGLSVLELTNKPQDIDTGYQLIATFLQLSWISAVFGLLVTIGMKLKHIILLIGTMTFTGVIFINSIFVWPKFFSASLAIMGCVLLFDVSSKYRKRIVVSSIILIGLGLLIHDNIAFTILGSIAVLLFMAIRNILSKPNHKIKTMPWRSVFIGCITALLIATPWIIYKDMNSTSDRLIKWQFAGVIKPNNNSTISTLINAYKGIPFSTWLSNRWVNLETILKPILSHNLTMGIKSIGFSKSAIKASLSSLSVWYEENNFFALLFSFGLFNLGWLLLAIRKNAYKVSTLQKYLFASSLIGIIFWIILMFIPGSTVIHQGSYAALLILFCLFGAWLSHTSLLYILFLLQFVAFNIFYVIGIFIINNLSPNKSWKMVLVSILVAICFLIISKVTKKMSLQNA